MSNYCQGKVITDKNSNRIIIRKKDANNRLVFPMTHVAAVIDDEGKSLEETINNLYNDIEHLQPDGFEELKSKVTALESLVSEGNNPTAAIDKFNEIVTFLDKFENTQTLDHILVTIKQDLTNSLSNKQDIITDLEVIRNGAAAGAMAQQPATTIAGYGITDAYTKQEVNNLVSTPHQKYITVANYASLPISGSADTIYRVSSYDGVQVDTTKYAEYAWDGTTYVLLSVKGAIGNVFDASAVEEDGFHVTDEDMNVGMKYDKDGLDAAKVSSHFIEVLKAAGVSADDVMTSHSTEVNEDGFFIADESLNVGVKVDNGGIHAKNILEYEIIED